VWATGRDLVTDAGASPYHVPAWLALAATSVVCVAVVVPALRRGVPWRASLPDGYGALGAGVLVVLAYLVVDVAWREGVGIDERSLEGGVAPSRTLLLVGLVLVACGPLRAALRGSADGPARAAAIPSAAIVLAVLGLPAPFNPVVNPWYERAPLAPEAALRCG
jgi:hypothetical protein